MTIPAYLPYFVFAGTAATLIAILYGLNRALVDAAWPASERTRAFRVSAVILLLAVAWPYESPGLSTGWAALLAYPRLYGGWLLWAWLYVRMKAR